MTGLAEPSRVKGWCPGALRPMESGDGLIVRVRVSGGALGPAAAAALADLAGRHGNGLIDLTQRANLQLRGVDESGLPSLLAGLGALGLLDDDAAREAIRNIVPPPLGGLDPTAAIDGRALTLALEEALMAADDLTALPGKFGFSVDDGGRIGLGGVAVDIRLIAGPHGITLAAGSGDGSAMPVAVVAPADAPDAAIALARAFLALAPGHGARRMPALLAAIGPAAIARAAGLDPASAVAARPARRTRSTDLVGYRDGVLGVAPAFGRLEAADLARLASTGAELRLTPFRVILLPGAGATLLSGLAGGGLITDPADPRLAVVACTGAPRCPHAHIDARAIAAALSGAAMPLAGDDGIGLHVSGCTKGCARPGPAPVTLAGTGGGLALILGGTAADRPNRILTAESEALAALAGLPSSGARP